MVDLPHVVYRYYEWLHGYAKCCYMLYTGITNNYMIMLSVWYNYIVYRYYENLHGYAQCCIMSNTGFTKFLYHLPY